jgi:hypothetical protein
MVFWSLTYMGLFAKIRLILAVRRKLLQELNPNQDGLLKGTDKAISFSARGFSAVYHAGGRYGFQGINRARKR